jgi:hypothetical protein
VSRAVPEPPFGNVLEDDAGLAADVASAKIRAMLCAVPVPSVCALLDVDTRLTAMALTVIGGFEPFDQPGIETIAGEEISRHRAAPVAGTGGDFSVGNFSLSF